MLKVLSGRELHTVVLAHGEGGVQSLFHTTLLHTNATTPVPKRMVMNIISPHSLSVGIGMVCQDTSAANHLFYIYIKIQFLLNVNKNLLLEPKRRNNLSRVPDNLQSLH